jgi:hypothetical protein
MQWERRLYVNIVGDVLGHKVPQMLDSVLYFVTFVIHLLSSFLLVVFWTVGLKLLALLEFFPR